MLLGVFFSVCAAEVLSASSESGNIVQKTSDAHKRVCAAGHEYYICDSEAVNRHAPRTCSRPKRGQTFSHCQNNGTACVGGWHAKFGGSGPGGSTLNAENTDVSTVVCGNPNTGACGNPNTGPGACSAGGTASSATAHQTTCLAGHTYWSCNANAVVPTARIRRTRIIQTTPTTLTTRIPIPTRRRCVVRMVGRIAGVRRGIMMPSVARDTRIIRVTRPPWRITRNISNTRSDLRPRAETAKRAFKLESSLLRSFVASRTHPF